MAQFKIYKDTLGKYRFFFKVSNNLLVLISEPYPSMFLCLERIHLFKNHSQTNKHYKRHIASCGSPYFIFQIESNGEIIGSSESFLNTSTMEKVIDLAKAKATLAKIEDVIYSI